MPRSGLCLTLIPVGLLALSRLGPRGSECLGSAKLRTASTRPASDAIGEGFGNVPVCHASSESE